MCERQVQQNSCRKKVIGTQEDKRPESGHWDPKAAIRVQEIWPRLLHGSGFRLFSDYDYLGVHFYTDSHYHLYRRQSYVNYDEFSSRIASKRFNRLAAFHSTVFLKEYIFGRLFAIEMWTILRKKKSHKQINNMLTLRSNLLLIE